MWNGSPFRMKNLPFGGDGPLGKIHFAKSDEGAAEWRNLIHDLGCPVAITLEMASFPDRKAELGHRLQVVINGHVFDAECIDVAEGTVIFDLTLRDR